MTSKAPARRSIMLGEADPPINDPSATVKPFTGRAAAFGLSFETGALGIADPVLTAGAGATVPAARPWCNGFDVGVRRGPGRSGRGRCPQVVGGTVGGNGLGARGRAQCRQRLHLVAEPESDVWLSASTASACG